jgi:hypothetical protein
MPLKFRLGGPTVKRVVLAAALMAGASGCGSGGAVDLGAASDQVAAPKFNPNQVAGLPPNGSQPSRPPTGACLISSPVSVPVTYYVYSDGRIIWQKWTGTGAPRIIPKGATAVSTVFVEQQLTPRGARLLRSQIKATGRFQPVRLPTSAWADRTIRPFIPSRYMITHDHGGPDPSRMRPTAGAALARFTGFIHNGDQIITLTQAMGLAHAFLKAGITPAGHWPGGALVYNALNGDTGSMSMVPQLPC